MTEQFLFGMVALASSAAWALGAVLWRKLGDALTPGGMNFAKVVLGSVLMAGLLPFTETAAFEPRSFLLLGVSGLLGIAVGDTFFFVALLKLGPRRASLMGCLNPVLIALGSLIFLGERPAALAWAGIVATTLGVSWVLYQRTPTRAEQVNLKQGVLFGILAILCTMASVLLAKIGLVHMPSLQATLIRLVWAVGGMLVYGLVRGTLGTWLAPLRSGRLLLRVIAVVVIVVVGGFWLSLVALKHIDASIAGTLGSAAPILILPMVYFILRERISPRAIAGALVAVGGIALIFAASGERGAAHRAAPDRSRGHEGQPPLPDAGLAPAAAAQRDLADEDDLAWRLRCEGARHRLASPEPFWDLLALKPGMAVLDIGTGAGYLALEVAQRLQGTGHVCATDVDPQMVAQLDAAARRLRLGNLRAVRVGPGIDPFYAREQHDLILITNVRLVGIPEREYFALLHRQLKPGGRLIVRYENRRARFPRFSPQDLTDPAGLVRALAREPAAGPFAGLLSPAVRRRVRALTGGAPSTALVGAILDDLNQALAEPTLGRRFIRAGRFVDERFASPAETAYANYLLQGVLHVGGHQLPDGGAAPEEWQAFARRLNNRLFVRRFGAFLAPAWSSPYWPGRPAAHPASQPQGDEETNSPEGLIAAGWKLTREAHDVAPYHGVLVFR